MSPSRIASPTSMPPPHVFTLLDGTGPVGCIDENRVRFTGFADPNEAAAAAWVAHVALERRRARRSRDAPPRLEFPRLFLVRTGGQEWIAAAEKRLARLVRPNSQDTSLQSHETADRPARWFGIEIEFPPDASELTVGSGAHVMYLALRRSGLPWSARSAGLAPDSAPAPAARRAAVQRLALQTAAAQRTTYASIGG